MVDEALKFTYKSLFLLTQTIAVMNQSLITRFFSSVLFIILSIYTFSEVSAQATLDSSVVDKSLIGNKMFSSLNHVKLDRKLDTLVQRTESLRLDADSLYSMSSLAPYHKSMHIVKALTGVNYQSETANATASTQSFQLQIKDDAGSLLDGLQTVYSQTANLDLTSFATFNETAGDARGFILNVRDAGYYHLECQIHFASDVDQHVEVEVYRSYDSASSGTGSVVNTKVAYGSGMVYNSYNQVGGTINCSAIVENSIAGGDFYITINVDGANGTLDVEEFDLAISRIGEY